MEMSQSVLGPRAVSGSMALQQEESGLMSMAHVTTKGPADGLWSGLLPVTMLVSEGCAKLAPPLTDCRIPLSTRKNWPPNLTLAVLESWPWWFGCGRVGRLTNSAITQAQILGFELTHSDIYPIYDLPKGVKEHWFCRSKVVGSPRHRAATGYPRGVPVRVQY
ncbi:hypothetical protein STEG23_004123 [Scotinomys teguina]